MQARMCRSGDAGVTETLAGRYQHGSKAPFDGTVRRHGIQTHDLDGVCGGGGSVDASGRVVHVEHNGGAGKAADDCRDELRA